MAKTDFERSLGSFPDAFRMLPDRNRGGGEGTRQRQDVFSIGDDVEGLRRQAGIFIIAWESDVKVQVIRQTIKASARAIPEAQQTLPAFLHQEQYFRCRDDGVNATNIALTGSLRSL